MTFNSCGGFVLISNCVFLIFCGCLPNGWSTAISRTEINGPAMIDALASRNGPPIFTVGEGPQAPVFDAEYNWSEQARVESAIDDLVASAEATWPAIVAHCDDDRYCVTCRRPGLVNLSVGEVCKMVIGDYLMAGYYSHIPQRYRNAHNGIASRSPAGVKDDDLKAWCEKRLDRKLYELQVEACVWAETHLASFAATQETERAITAIRSARDELTNSQRPIRVTKLASHAWRNIKLFTSADGDHMKE